jgi:hypothetical protein
VEIEMKNIQFFLKYGWKSIWKQKIIWLFSLLPVLSDFFQYSQLKNDRSVSEAILFFIITIIPILFFFTSYIGVPYLAYSFSVGKPVSIHETLAAVKKFSGRVVGCSCLGFILLSPLFFLMLYQSINNPERIPQLSDNMILTAIPFSIFNALWQFSMISFFANDWGIRQGVKEAWALFTKNFLVLAFLGIFLIILVRFFDTISGILTLIIQSGFDRTAFRDFNYLIPSSSLNNNLLFEFISGIVSIIHTSFSASVFVLAYLKYSGAKISKSLLNE